MAFSGYLWYRFLCLPSDVAFYDVNGNISGHGHITIAIKTQCTLVYPINEILLTLFQW